MRLYLIQSRETGNFLIPVDGYIGWTRSLRIALEKGLVDHEMATDLIYSDTDNAEIVFIRYGENDAR